MKKSKKIFYISFTGFLTSIAVSACYWQGSKYFDSRKRWNLIAIQLSSLNPTKLAQLSKEEKNKLFPFKFIQIEGKLSDQYVIVTRPRGMRTGYLVLRKITYEDHQTKQQHQMIALDGWCPQNWDLKNRPSLKQPYQGILRKKESTDYLHKKLKQSDLNKFNMNTWIDLQKYLAEFGISPDPVNANFYFQILKPLQSERQEDEGEYPYRYSVDNFELPYLTPDKHRGYATFWFCTSLVGLGAIFKVLKMK